MGQMVSFKALRSQLKNAAIKYYYYDSNSLETHEQLPHMLQTNDCREIVTAAVDGDDLANAFALAAKINDVDILEAFLHHGMNVDIKDKSGWTALIGASYSSHEECVRFLLDHNASVDIQDSDGKSALMIASQRGNTNIVKILLEKNANSDLQDDRGRTALMFASAYGHKEIVQMLLNHDVNTDLKNDKGKTALDLTTKKEIKELLLNHVRSSYVLK